jgi:predicted DNA-binding transcriptional regulator AlpA
MKTIEIADRFFEDREALMDRLGIKKDTLWRMQQRGLPKGMRLGKVLYFDRAKVDDWLLENAEAA